jgi:hypothetical protein
LTMPSLAQSVEPHLGQFMAQLLYIKKTPIISLAILT